LKKGKEKTRKKREKPRKTFKNDKKACFHVLFGIALIHDSQKRKKKK